MRTYVLTHACTHAQNPVFSLFLLHNDAPPGTSTANVHTLLSPLNLLGHDLSVTVSQQ